MEIYSELIKTIEQGNSLKAYAESIKPKLIHFIETIKQEIDLLKQQENLLQISCNFYNSLSKNFADRMIFLNRAYTWSSGDYYCYIRPLPLDIIIIEAISIFLNKNLDWKAVCLNISNRSILLDVDYNQLSEQALYNLGIFINANRKNLACASPRLIYLFRWLETTYDWAIKIRYIFPQFKSFKEIDRLVNRDFLEYSNLKAVRNTIKNKEIELDLLERVELSIIKNILDL